MTSTAPLGALAASGSLQSDHVNYLILRYLQESGHENAAEALYRDWRRSAEHRDPESYPFARAVQRRELVSIVQQGLALDELRASVGKNERQFRFTTATVDDDRTSTRGDHVRPLSRGRKSIVTAMRAPDEFPAPPSKRQRRSEGSEGALTNGGMMDLDGDSSVDADDTFATASPGLESETEDMVERYDSMEIGTQTETKTTKTTSLCWTIDKSGAKLMRALWNPNASSPENARTLLTVGESLSRLHLLPASSDGSALLHHSDNEIVDAHSTVTAAAWHPAGHSFVCAIDTLRPILPDRGGSIVQDATTEEACIHETKIIGHSIIKGNFLFPFGKYRSESPSYIVRMSYDPFGKFLMVVESDGVDSSITVWRTETSIQDGQETVSDPYACGRLRGKIRDAMWQWRDNYGYGIIAHGDAKVEFTLKEYHSGQDLGGLATSLHNLWVRDYTELAPEKRSVKLIHVADSRSSVRVNTTPQTDDLGFGTVDVIFPERHYDRWTQPVWPISMLGDFADVALRQTPDYGIDDSVAVLAIAYQEGFCTFHTLSIYQPFHARSVYLPKLTNMKRPQPTFWLASGPVLAVAFSPSGAHLAVAGTDVMEVWVTRDLMHLVISDEEEVDNDKPLSKEADDEESLDKEKGEKRPAPPSIVSWSRPTARKTPIGDGEVREVSEPSLEWSADGQAVVFSARNEVSLVIFPPRGACSISLDMN